MDNEIVVLKYNKEIAVKTCALTYKLYIFMLSIVALIVLISSAIFDFICYKNGFCEEIIIKYTSKIIYMSLFIALVWIFCIPVWYPAHVAENSVFVIKNNKLYRIRNKKDNIFDRKKYLENEEFFNKVLKNLPEKMEKVIIEEYDSYSILDKNEKYMTIQVKYNNKFKKIKIYNIYDNYKKLLERK